MAVVTVNISNINISVKGKNTSTVNISWTAPSLPDGALINSCILTGSASSFTTGNKGATLKIGNIDVDSNSSFNVNLGTDISITSAQASFSGRHN